MIATGSHPGLHPLFETLGYAAGYGIFRRMRRRDGDVIVESQRWIVIAAAAVGALLGSRLLGILEQWPTLLAALHSGRVFMLAVSGGGKTIVGGLLGGWLAVELIKPIAGICSRTGDLFAVPLCIGIAVGRIGCILAGPADDTFGKTTNLPWGIDFGDGVSRHPVQVYEILFLILLAVWLSRAARWPEGARFRAFLAAYLSWRFFVDFLKPQPLLADLNVIQWACGAGLVILATTFVMGLRFKGKEMREQAFS